MDNDDNIVISKEVLNGWAETCLYICHHGDLILEQLPPTADHEKAIKFTSLARKQARQLLNELVEQGAEKPDSDEA